VPRRERRPHANCSVVPAFSGGREAEKNCLTLPRPGSAFAVFGAPVEREGQIASGRRRGGGVGSPFSTASIGPAAMIPPQSWSALTILVIWPGCCACSVRMRLRCEGLSTKLPMKTTHCACGWTLCRSRWSKESTRSTPVWPRKLPSAASTWVRCSGDVSMKKRFSPARSQISISLSSRGRPKIRLEPRAGALIKAVSINLIQLR
jgi:hypothetical protein